MFKFPLDSGTDFLIVAPRWSEFALVWQVGLLALLLCVPLALVLCLAWYELRLIARPHAAGLLLLRLAVLCILWLVIGWQPYWHNVRVKETPGRVRIAVDLSSSMDVIDRPGTLTRKALARQILSPEGHDLIQRLAHRHEVEMVGFHESAFDLSPAQVAEHLQKVDVARDIQGTDLNQSLARLNSTRAQPLLGIILLTDGRHHTGVSPVQHARELGKTRIPIYPVVIGPKDPPADLAIVKVDAPTREFLDTTIPVTIHCNVTGMKAQALTVEMQINGKPALKEHRQTIKHGGEDRNYAIQFQAKMDQAGAHTLTIHARSKTGEEITLQNNSTQRVVRVTDDRVKTLLVDGEARWEYHYLANAFLRDKTIALDRVVFVQPRIGVIKTQELEKAGLAKTKLPEPKAENKKIDPLLDYDCIFLGDVSPEQVPLADRKRLEKYVAERGGTLVFLVGKRSLPLAFTRADAAGTDPFSKMLPVSEPREIGPKAGFTLRTTLEGKLTPFLQLGERPEDDIWKQLPKHYWGIVGKRRPAATVLLAPVVDGKSMNPGGKEDKGILVQQNYGLGRVVFVGLDSTWRWRFRVGDTYHHRFWGQLARAAAADKLLPAGNHHIRFGAREPVYSVGDEVDVAARLNAALPPLQDPALVRAKLLRKNKNGPDVLVASVPLGATKQKPNLFETKVRDLAPGTYRVELDIPQYRSQIAEPGDDKKAPDKERDLFRVLPREQKELLDLSADWSLMRNIAEFSDGRIYTPENVEEIVERLAQRIERHEHSEDSKPWQDVPMVWWLLGILLGLLSVEWVWRKLVELP
ncbi:MAG: hypothetical protein HYX68_28625 [Planctomycetes bacterium]|nr:hypothetical protein [Planctomycetota bacterium]